MAEAGDIVGISIPFTAGVAAAALVPEGPVRYMVATLVCSAVCAAFATFCLKGTRKAAAAVLFFCIGALGMLTRDMAGGSSGGQPQWASGAMKSFCTLIDSIEFDGAQTGALVKALLTGRKDSLTAETVQLFRASGGAHILALSGLHLGVLYGIMTRVLAPLGNSRAASAVRSVLITASSCFYMVMTGASASIVRAFLFITINELARHFPGRRRAPLNVLCSALMIQLTVNPLIIRSTGFQLSYLAMLGIFTIFPRLDGWYPESGRFDLPRKIWKSAALSLSCQVLTAPVVWLRFRTFPRYFLVTNLLALPLAELLIIASVICIAGAAAGWCPDILKSPVDLLARTLIFCLETVSTM